VKEKTKKLEKTQKHNFGPADSISPAEKAARKLRNGSRPPEILPFAATLAYVFRDSGGVETAIEGAKLVAEEGDERFIRLIHAWDTLTKTDKEKVRLEDLLAAAELTSKAFLGAVIPALYQRNMDISRLLVSTSHSRVVGATIDNALNPRGVMDRKMIHDVVGFLPQPKGNTFIVDQRQLTVGGGEVKAVEEAPMRTQLPSFEQSGIELMTAIRGDAGVGTIGSRDQKRIEAPKPKEEVLEAEIVQQDDH
jgi:hypothetical protein